MGIKHVRQRRENGGEGIVRAKMREGEEKRSQWKVERFFGKNAFWREQMPCHNFLTHSSNHRCVWTNRIRDPQNALIFLVKW